MTRSVRPAILGLSLICGFAVAYDIMSGRYGEAGVLRAATARIDTLPVAAGDWMSSEVEMSVRELELASITGCYARDFTEAAGEGRPVQVLVMCGPYGPLSQHEPTACLRGSGWRQTADTAEFAFGEDDGGGHSLWSATFTGGPQDGIGDIRVFWGWSTDGVWDAAWNARLDFAGSEYLYKLYVVTGDEGPESEAAVRDLLDRLLPVFKTKLAPRESGGEA